MKAKDIILFGAGAVIGYLFVKLNWNKKIEPITDAITEKAHDAVDTVKQAITKEDQTIHEADCEAKWIEHSKTIRYANANAKNIAKNIFMTECKQK